MHPNIPEEAYNMFLGIHIILMDCDRLVLEKFNLSVQRYFILHHVKQEPGISFTRLSELAFADKGSVSRMVRGLELNGLIVREQSEEDRRYHNLTLTEEGEKLYQAAAKARNNDLAARFESLKNYDTDTLFTDLGALRDDFLAHLNALYAHRNGNG